MSKKHASQKIIRMHHGRMGVWAYGRMDVWTYGRTGQMHTDISYSGVDKNRTQMSHQQADVFV